jgi:hypothetical protein
MDKITITKYRYQCYTVSSETIFKTFTGKTARAKAMSLFKKVKY